jgi:hypothetical protein
VGVVPGDRREGMSEVKGEEQESQFLKELS